MKRPTKFNENHIKKFEAMANEIEEMRKKIEKMKEKTYKMYNDNSWMNYLSEKMFDDLTDEQSIRLSAAWITIQYPHL